VRILLVEDERSAARMIAKGLREHGNAVDVVGDGLTALQQAWAADYDLIVLDRLLPLKDGVAVCRELRRGGHAAKVLMLTARDAIADRVEGLDAGADDYLTKPFAFSELLARVRALARRPAAVLESDFIDCGRIVLDTRTQDARVDGQHIELTAREYAVLEYLARRPGTVVSRDDLAQHVWDNRYDPTTNVIEVFIQRLRRKIDRGGDSFIRTRRGAGYQFVGLRNE
jgi:DNA-binding response OmpR family regulator